MEKYQFYVLLIVALVSLVVSLGLLLRLVFKRSRGGELSSKELHDAISEVEKRFSIKLEATTAERARDIEQLRSSLGDSISVRMDALSSGMSHGQSSMQQSVNEKLDGVNTLLTNENTRAEQRFKSFESMLAQRLASLGESITAMRTTNEEQLDAIRGVVNEKLQQTLNERLGESFKRVEERLSEVYKGLGEMQTLASGVGDLKKVLSNVKTRGTLGEIQLKAILEEVLASEQYELNFDPGKGGSERVEFAIKLPSDESSAVYLPIDSKFPADKYVYLCDAYDSGDPAQIESAKKALKESILKFGKDIHDKYVNPPRTTNFAIMFLPTEGLYAEAVRMGLIELLQSRFRVNLSGPSTMAALLNSLQMGFRTLAIQKRSSEVWDILARIKKEFRTFDNVLANTKKALDKANSELDTLVGVRTRQILRALNKVEELPSDEDNKPDALGIDTVSAFVLDPGDSDDD